ncbi:MAG: hypothetical protein IIY77_06160 [Lachnospiraceae bacterium]|nr:hypothetical protein [Lachnospiraceae bacterium]
MFDDYLIRKDSLRNVVKDGKVWGFKFGVRIADYRGCFLSLHNGYYVCCDGVEYPREDQLFEINGKDPRTFEEIKTAVWEHWNFDDEGTLYVRKEGGLEPGMHKIGLQQSILAAYGYMPTDELWVKEPPVPGHGAGAGKTGSISWFDLELQEG